MLFHVSAYSRTSGKPILNIKKYLTVSKTNNSLIVSEWDRDKSLGINVCHHPETLVMSNGDPQDRFFLSHSNTNDIFLFYQCISKSDIRRKCINMKLVH